MTLAALLLACVLGTLAVGCLYMAGRPEWLVRFVLWRTIDSLKQLGFELKGTVEPTPRAYRSCRFVALFFGVYLVFLAWFVWRFWGGRL
jgi:hypothetical protein